MKSPSSTELPGLTQCPRCDYDLAGLPAEYQCPECGFAYDESTVPLYGDRLGPRIVAPQIILFAGYIGWVLAMRFDPRLGLTIITVGVSLAIYVWYRRRRVRKRGGPTLLVIHRDGILVRNDQAEIQREAKIIPWNRLRTVQLKKYFIWRWSRTKPLPPQWLLTFSSGSVFDPMRMIGRAPSLFSKDRTYIAFTFEASAERARMIEKRIATLRSDAEQHPD